MAPGAGAYLVVAAVDVGFRRRSSRRNATDDPGAVLGRRPPGARAGAAYAHGWERSYRLAPTPTEAATGSIAAARAPAPPGRERRGAGGNQRREGRASTWVRPVFAGLSSRK